MAAGERVNDFFNFSGDDVAAGEFRVVEDPAEDTLGEQMLDEHGLNRVVREVGIDGLTAEQDKALKAVNELFIGFALFFNDPFDGDGDFRNAAGKVGYGGFPFLMLRLTVLEKLLEQIDKVVRVGDVFIQALAHALLVKNGLLRALKDDVVSGIALFQLLLDFFFQRVFQVFGFPETMLEGEGIKNHAINNNGFILRRRQAKLLHQLPFKLSCAIIQERSKGLPDGGLMADIELPELV
ncbi:MAG TPA: hypothetical protein VGQ12_17220 [Candidatus Angelobacter sp.]|nr:hypothetical protein [Candidatus Angelobacter sp.]